MYAVDKAKKTMKSLNACIRVNWVGTASGLSNEKGFPIAIVSDFTFTFLSAN